MSLKILLFILCLLPFLLLLQDTLADQLGPNPIETLHFRLGDWALRFLLLTLAITPYKQMTGQAWVNRYRRMLGLYAFFYASLHLLVYIVLDLSLSWDAFTDEFKDSPYILFGLLTYALLLPLAVTSTRRMQQKLGRHWKKLHRLIYIAAITAILHHMLLTKSDLKMPLIYADIVLILLGYRLISLLKKLKKTLLWRTGDRTGLWRKQASRK